MGVSMEVTEKNSGNNRPKHNPGAFLPVIMRIALRNLTAHRSRTLIIGTLVAIGIILLIVGNSMLDTAEAGIRKTYIDNFTGNLILRAKADGDFSLFSMDMNLAAQNGGLPRIPKYDTVYSQVSSMPEIAAATPHLTGRGMIIHNEKFLRMLLLFGIDPESYLKVFPHNIEIISGEFLKQGQEGILISETAMKDLGKENGYTPAIGDSILVAGLSTGGFALREVTLRGIFRYKNSNEFLDMVSLIDARSLRKMLNITSGTEKEITLGKDESALLEFLDEENFFPGDDIIKETKISENNPLDLFKGEKREPEKETLDQGGPETGEWHFLVIKLKNSMTESSTAKKLVDPQGQPDSKLYVMNWEESAGTIGMMSSAIKIVFNVLILIIAVVAVIIIMNTIVISITERIPEIGTMRALGAKKEFITRLILSEVMLIVAVFGLIGIALGAGILFILNATGIQAPNLFFEIIFGGKALNPVFSLTATLTALVVILGIGIIASLYPLSIALRIQPVCAIQQE